MIYSLLVSVVIGSLSLWIGSKVTPISVSIPRIVLIAFLAQFITPYVLTYLAPMIAFPFSTFLIQLFVWVGLIKFTAQKVSVINAIILGAFAFGISYFLTISGIRAIIRGLLL